uniref:Uncharacterized protein n=1 Tax=Chenopodium quinoa TaxID=63459 RepID=A0A803M4B9_CHEQI
MMSSISHPTLIIGIIVYGLNLGFIESYFRVVTDYYWKDVQRINPSSAQLYAGLYFIPWMLRPLWGLLSDVFPIRGYHRRPYFIAAGVIGALSTVLVTMISTLPVSLALVCFIGVVCGMAVATATIDACIAKHSIQVKELAPESQSLRGDAVGLLTIAPASFLVLGFLVYELRSVSNPTHASNKVAERVGSAMENMYKTMKFPQVWKPSFFMFLSLALSYSTHEGHFYWYTDPKLGLGFSKEFIRMVYAIGAVGSIVGVFIYHKFLKDFPLRTLLFYAQLLYAASGMLDLMFILRWNLPLGNWDP